MAEVFSECGRQLSNLLSRQDTFAVNGMQLLVGLSGNVA